MVREDIEEMELAPMKPDGWAKRVRGAMGSLPSLLSREPAWQRLAHEEEESGEDAEPSGRWCPEENAGWVSRLLFAYVNGLVRKGSMKTLHPDDLWDVALKDLPATVGTRFEDSLASTRMYGSQGVVWRAMWRVHGRAFLFAGFIKFIHDVVMLIGPFVLELLLKGLERGESKWFGFGMSLALAFSNVFECISINMYFHILYRIGLHLKIGLIDTLHRKSLRITSASRGERGVGTIVTLMSNDAAKLWNLPQYLHMLWSGPFQILAVLALLVRVIHFFPALAGLAVTLCLIPLSTAVANRLATIRKALMQQTDRRVKLCSEVVGGMKAIKLYAWEDPYLKRIQAIRDAELVQVKRMAIMSIFNSVIFLGGTTLISLAAFAVYAAQGYPLTAATAFPALALFNLLRFPVMVFPSQIASLVQGKVALKRIQDFVEEEEMQQAELEAAVQPPSAAISVRSGSFAWELEGRPTLRNINLQVGAGQLVAVVGEVGSGKSSLLNALLGEMRARGGSVSVAGTVAYTAQDAWIQNATLRENVLMGKEMRREWYDAVLAACALGPDLAMLAAGDQTEIGEKGVNLSGGQRHRVALARACYADSDVFFLDDPLSAVDAHVGRHLFSSCICGLLQGRTRVLVTHQMHFLGDPGVDLIVVLRHGEITQSGTYSELLAEGVDFHQFDVEPLEDQVAEAQAPVAGTLETLESIEEEAELESVTLPTPMDAAALAVTPVTVASPLQDALHPLPSSSGAAQPSLPANTDVSLRQAEHLAGAGHSGRSSTPNGEGETVSASATASVVPWEDDGRNASGQASSASDHESGDEGDRLLETDARTDSAYEGRFGKSTGRGGEGLEEYVSINIGEANGALGGQGEKEGANGRSGRIIKAEEREEGQVKRTVYLTYLSAWGPWFWVPLSVLALALLERSLQVGQNAWLAVWSNATSKALLEHRDLRPLHYLAIYFVLGIVSLFVQCLRSYWAVLGTVSAARKLHTGLLKKVLRLPMSFFDSQPVGRLINRFSRDIESLDTSLGNAVQSFTNCLVSVVGAMLVVVFVTPGVLIGVVPLGFLYRRVQSAYIATSRELKRLDSLAMSPIFSAFAEVVAGLPTIRAFRQQSLFTQRSQAMLLASNRIYWPIQCVNRWLSVRLELLGISVVFGTAIFAGVLLPRSAGVAGLAITSALNLTGLLNWFVRTTTELEVSMNSVERVVEYETSPSEAPPISASYRPPAAWPQAGAISVEGLVVRYRPDLDPVLRGLSFNVHGKEKIGIAGRTGCGKSTMILALYRLIEPMAGRMRIDGVDICKIGLFDLRSRLVLVPQDPVVFSGTVRSNLDPFGTCAMAGDAPLWAALGQSGLSATISALPGELDAAIAEGGCNLSTGQRQLLCMARALLRRTRILILDEATSNVDPATDSIIQSTIRTAFAECTVLTIAHRLHTIIDSDRVLLLDAGQLAEFDSPTNLLKNPSSAFYGMVQQAGRPRSPNSGNGLLGAASMVL